MIPADEQRAGASLARSLRESADDWRKMAKRYPWRAERYNALAKKAEENADWWDQKLRRDRELSDAH